MGKIKNWKRVYGEYETTNGVTFRNKNDFLVIQPSGGKRFKVFFESQTKKVYWQNEFKSKISASKYAHKYMKSHPRG